MKSATGWGTDIFEFEIGPDPSGTLIWFIFAAGDVMMMQEANQVDMVWFYRARDLPDGIKSQY